MTHLWIRAESRPNEERTGITPDGVAALVKHGLRVTVEDCPKRILRPQPFADAGAEIAPKGSWPDAPRDAIILGLKELPEADTPLIHRHIMFGHAYKGQSTGARLLKRFAAGGGSLYDLEYLVDDNGRRVAAFGYWAGYAGAAVSLLAWAAQGDGKICPPVATWDDADELKDTLRAALDTVPRASVIVIGAKGRVGSGARDLCGELDLPVTAWDMAETARGAPFPEILDHGIFLNCILASEGVPVFVPPEACSAERALRVIGDIACDPDSPFNPIPLYHEATSWSAPVARVSDAPPLDIMAIDNLPSLLPRESSHDFAQQLLPHLMTLDDLKAGVWGRAHETYLKHKPKDAT
ncbi:MAG: saccharopine dehydrogenase [Mameliella sp.]|nr:saccharopine dehydrogenase [Mameliella sp.]|tara:strand:- start:946 stop:2001 length:1056 start_codon:yes stop_codon:yes gene_type:complete